MKARIYVSMLTLILAFSTITTQASVVVESKEAIKERIAHMTEAQKQERGNYIKLRVEEIRKMDKSNLTSQERKELRQELRAMKYEANSLGSGGVYLSLAGIIIIILLLILIL